MPGVISNPVLLALIAIMLNACASPDLRKQASVVQRENQRSELLVSDYRDGGVFLQSEEFDALTDKIIARLYPRRDRHVVVRIARLPEDNAFALPTHVIVIHLGLLAALENEDQLAFVIAHEVAHIDASHGYLSAHTRRYSRIAAHMADILSFGSGASYGHFARRLSSASRRQEYYADRTAALVTQRAGYNLAQAANFFDVLHSQPKLDSTPLAVRTHPTHSERRERVNSFRVQAGAKPDESEATQTDANVAFDSFRLSILPMSIKDKIAELSFVSALSQIQMLQEAGGNRREIFCLRGDAFLGIAQAGAADYLPVVTAHFSSDSDQTSGVPVVYDEKAEQYYFYRRAQLEYLSALEIEPEATCAVRGAGVSSHALGSYHLAGDYLSRYSAQNPSANDIRYIKYLLSEMPPVEVDCSTSAQDTCL